MAEHAEGSSDPRDAVVNLDVSCVQCAYVLRGLPRSGVCPECGTAVSISLSPRPLHERPREVLESERRGAAMVQYGLVAYVLTAILAIAVSMILAWQWTWQVTPGGTPTSPTFPVAPTPTWSTFIASSIVLIPVLVVARGYWRLGTTGGDEPRDETGGSRDVLRAGAWVLAVSIVLEFLTNAWMTVVSWTNPAGSFGWPMMVFSMATLLWQLGSIVGFGIVFFSSMGLVIRLSERGLARDLARRTRRDRVLIPIVTVLGSCVMVGPLIGLVLYYGRLDQFRRMLSGALRVQDELARRPV